MSSFLIRLEALKQAPATGEAQRVQTELAFALRMDEDGAFCGPIEASLARLERGLAEEGCLTKHAALEAEALLMPLAAEAKKYTVLCVGHAHIDMNWMWRYDETVSITLDTFRTVLQLMNEYPEFTYSQSQASVYEIVEKHDPAMLQEIKRRVKEGRWEVAASTWVEADRNMPSGESVARHHLYTRRYLSRLLDIPPESLNLDYEPDTFGHGAMTPEMLNQGGIKYYYHCRGDNEELLFRWASPSGADILCYREPFWYLGPVKYDFGLFAPSFFKKYGLRTMMRVYGVGDHGGGPTRRDIQRVLEMAAWPVYPNVRFGSYREFFAEAEKAQNLTRVEGELNFIFTGCYTTQSRIKMANRFGEAHLDEGEKFAALATLKRGRPYAGAAFESAWRKVLFNQFHDIIPGSGVIDTREHAMGIFSEALAVADTQKSQAMRLLGEEADTAAYLNDEGESESISEGAGVGFGTGFGVKDARAFRVGQTERGSGINRVFHLYNPQAVARTEVVELTVWDWPGDMERMRFIAPDGSTARHQILGEEPLHYWQHEYRRILVEATLPALGRATYVLTQADDKPDSPDFPNDPRRHAPFTFTLENSCLRAEFCPTTGKITALIDKQTGRSLLDGPGGFFNYILEDVTGDWGTAWIVGRYRSVEPMIIDVRMWQECQGPLMDAVKIETKRGGSVVTYIVRLFEHAPLLDIDVQVEWREVGVALAETPQLSFTVPIASGINEFVHDVPGGLTRRPALDLDVPCQSFAAAPLGDGRALMLVSDAKYGFRCKDGVMSLTCIRSATDPDPHPEFGKHRFRIGLGVTQDDNASLLAASYAFCHPATPVNDRPRKGTAPLSQSYAQVCGAHLQAVKMAEDGGALIVRLVEITGADGQTKLKLWQAPKATVWADAHENPLSGDGIGIDGDTLTIPMRAWGTATLRLTY